MHCLLDSVYENIAKEENLTRDRWAKLQPFTIATSFLPLSLKLEILTQWPWDVTKHVWFFFHEKSIHTRLLNYFDFVGVGVGGGDMNLIYGCSCTDRKRSVCASSSFSVLACSMTELKGGGGKWGPRPHPLFWIIETKLWQYDKTTIRFASVNLDAVVGSRVPNLMLYSYFYISESNAHGVSAQINPARVRDWD